MTPTTTTPLPTMPPRLGPLGSAITRRPAAAGDAADLYDGGDAARRADNAAARWGDTLSSSAAAQTAPARRRRRRAGRHGGGSESDHSAQERWLLTYADMITLLVAFFIMLYAMAARSPRPDDARQQFREGARSALLGVGVPRPIHTGRIVIGQAAAASPATPSAVTQTSAGAARRRLFARMAAWIAERRLASQVRLQIEPGGVVLRLDSGAMLFDTGTATLAPRGARIVDGLQEALAPEVAAGLVGAVRVAGHTDDRAVAPGSPWASNWQLSAARAAGVAARLAGGPRGPSLAARLEATGFGESRPIASNAYEAGRRRNRRVEIRVQLAKPDPSADKQNK